MVTLTINGTLANLNDYTKACRTNRYLGAEMKKRMERVVSSHIFQQLDGVQFNEPVILSFRWYEPNKKRDLDNICFAKKFILDALVKNGVLVNDSWEWVKGFTDEFFVDRQNPRIEVDMEGAEGMSVEHKPNQNERILDYIERFGSITQLDALKDIGCMRLASRISDLKRLGYPIISEVETVENRFGEKVHIKRYRMECEE